MTVPAGRYHFDHDADPGVTPRWRRSKGARMSGKQEPTSRNVGRAIAAAVIAVVAIVGVGVLAENLARSSGQGPTFSDEASPAVSSSSGGESVWPPEETLEDTDTAEDDLVGEITSEYLTELNTAERDCGYADVSVLDDGGYLPMRSISRDPEDAIGQSGSDEDSEETCVLDALGLTDEIWAEVRDSAEGSREWISPAGNDWTIDWSDAGDGAAFRADDPSKADLYLYATY